MLNWVKELLELKPLIITRIEDIEFKVVKRTSKECYSAVMIQHTSTGPRILNTVNRKGIRSALYEFWRMVREEFLLRSDLPECELQKVTTQA